VIRMTKANISGIQKSAQSKKKANKTLIGVLGLLALASLTACGSAATPTALPPQSTATVPAAAATVPQLQPVATQAPITSDSSTGNAPTPDMSMSDTSTPEMVMTDTSTPAMPTVDTPVADTAVPAAPTPAADNATPTSAQASTSQGTGSSATSTTGTAAETDVQATLIEWAIKLSQSEVPAGKVRFTVTNQGTMMHNLTIENDSGVVAKTPTFNPSQGPQTLEVDLTPGTYTLICSILGHAQRGQMTTLTVLSQSN
jgi:uncharacterized cupredoxin-like copper-binding protein